MPQLDYYIGYPYSLQTRRWIRENDGKRLRQIGHAVAGGQGENPRTRCGLKAVVTEERYWADTRSGDCESCIRLLAYDLDVDYVPLDEPSFRVPLQKAAAAMAAINRATGGHPPAQPSTKRWVPGTRS